MDPLRSEPVWGGRALALRPPSRPSRQRQGGPLAPEVLLTLVSFARPRSREQRLGEGGDARDYPLMARP